MSLTCFSSNIISGPSSADDYRNYQLKSPPPYQAILEQNGWSFLHNQTRMACVIAAFSTIAASFALARFAPLQFAAKLIGVAATTFLAIRWVQARDQETGWGKLAVKSASLPAARSRMHPEREGSSDDTLVGRQVRHRHSDGVFQPGIAAHRAVIATTSSIGVSRFQRPDSSRIPIESSSSEDESDGEREITSDESSESVESSSPGEDADRGFNGAFIALQAVHQVRNAEAAAAEKARAAQLTASASAAAAVVTTAGVSGPSVSDSKANDDKEMKRRARELIGTAKLHEAAASLLRGSVALVAAARGWVPAPSEGGPISPLREAVSDRKATGAGVGNPGKEEEAPVAAQVAAAPVAESYTDEEEAETEALAAAIVGHGDEEPGAEEDVDSHLAGSLSDSSSIASNDAEFNSIASPEGSVNVDQSAPLEPTAAAAPVTVVAQGAPDDLTVSAPASLVSLAAPLLDRLRT